jgi:hypothetical protein
MEWIGNMNKHIGFVAVVLMDALFNDSAPTVMNSCVNHCVCQNISVWLRAEGLGERFLVGQEIFVFYTGSRPDLEPAHPPIQ